MLGCMSQRVGPTVTRRSLLVDGSDRTFRRFLHDFLVFSRRVAEVRDHFAQLVGVSPPQYEILSHLREAGDRGLSVGGIAERLHTSGAFATAEVRKLAAAKLVAKSPDPADARRVIVRLTPTARDRLGTLVAVQAPVNDALFASIPAERLPELADLMRRLLDDGDNALALVAFLAPAQRASSR